MGNLQSALALRKIQFLVLILLVGAATGILYNSEIGKQLGPVVGLLGMGLLLVVVFAGYKILFSNLPKDDEKKPDFVPDPEGRKSSSRMLELKYSAGPKGKKGKFEDYYKL